MCIIWYPLFFCPPYSSLIFFILSPLRTHSPFHASLCVMTSKPRSYFFFTIIVWDKCQQMVIQGVTWQDPAASWPLTGRWMLHNSRRRPLGGMWEMRGGGSENEGGEGLKLSASVPAVVSRHESQADEMGQWISTWKNHVVVTQYALVCKLRFLLHIVYN